MALKCSPFVSICLCLATLVCAIPTQAGVLISPARLEVSVGPDGRTPGLTVVNRGPESVAIRFGLAGGGHDLDGMPVFDESTATVERLAEFVQVSPVECLLSPGESTHIDVTAFPGQAGLYPAIIADIQPLSALQGGVVATARIAVPTLITKAQESRNPAIAASDVIIQQEQPGGPLSLETILHNNGNVHVRTGGRLVVSGQNVKDELIAKAVTILPGFARRVQVTWSPNALPPGEYLVEYLPDHPLGSEIVMSKSNFRVVEPYELAYAQLRLEHIKVSEVPGVLSYQVLVENTGNVGLQSDLEVQVVAPNGIPAATDTIAADVGVGSGRLLMGAINIHGVPPGDYVLKAVVHHQNQQLAVIEQPLRLSAAHLATR